MVVYEITLEFPTKLFDKTLLTFTTDSTTVAVAVRSERFRTEHKISSVAVRGPIRVAGTMDDVAALVAAEIEACNIS